jgi:hypothetical protein
VIVSRKVFADEIGVTVSRVAHYVALGMPAMSGVGVDRDVALEWVRANIQPQLGRNARKAGVRVSEITGTKECPTGGMFQDRSPDGTDPPRLDDQGNGDGPRLDPAQQRARRDAAMAERLELENARRSGELVDISCVRDSVAEDYVIARTQLSAIGSKLAPQLVGQRNAEVIKSIIDREIGRVLEVLSEDDVYEAAKAGADA